MHSHILGVGHYISPRPFFFSLCWMMSEPPLFPSQTLAFGPPSSTAPFTSTLNVTADSATLLQKVPPALLLLVPVISVALFILTITHRPQRESSPPRPQCLQARIAYAVVVALGLLSTIAGVLPFSRVGIRSYSKPEKVVEAFVSLLCAYSSTFEISLRLGSLGIDQGDLKVNFAISLTNHLYY